MYPHDGAIVFQHHERPTRWEGTFITYAGGIYNYRLAVLGNLNRNKIASYVDRSELFLSNYQDDFRRVTSFRVSAPTTDKIFDRDISAGFGKGPLSLFGLPRKTTHKRNQGGRDSTYYCFPQINSPLRCQIDLIQIVAILAQHVIGLLQLRIGYLGRT